MNQSKATNEFLKEDKEFIRLSYPSIDMKKYEGKGDPIPSTQFSLLQVFDAIILANFSIFEVSFETNQNYKLANIGMIVAVFK